MALVSWWKLDETSGTTLADSVGSNTLTLTASGFTLNQAPAPTPDIVNPASIAWTTGGGQRPGGAAGMANNSAAHSLACWVKFTSVAGTQSLMWTVGTGGTGNSNQLALRGGALRAEKGAGTLLCGTFTPTTGVWYHVCYTWDGSLGIIYINGAQQATSATSPGAATIAEIYLSTHIYVAEPIVGQQDDARYYDHALSPAEVQALFQSQPKARRLLLPDVADASVVQRRPLLVADGTLTPDTVLRTRHGQMATVWRDADYWRPTDDRVVPPGSTATPDTVLRRPFMPAQWETPAGSQILQRKLVQPFYVPLTIPGLVQWFRSDLGIGADTSGDLLALADMSGHGNHATALLATSPFWTPSGGINGLPRIVFNASPSWFMDGTTNPVPSGGARTCIAVMRNASGTPFQFRSTTPVFSVLWSSGGANTNVYTDGVGNSQAIPTVDYNRPTILEVAWDGNTAHDVTCTLNNGTQTVVHNLGTGTPSDTGATGFRVGAGFNGDLYEWAVYDHVLSPSEWSTLFAYLSPRYSIASEDTVSVNPAVRASLLWRPDGSGDWMPPAARRLPQDGTIIADFNPFARTRGLGPQWSPLDVYGSVARRFLAQSPIAVEQRAFRRDISRIIGAWDAPEFIPGRRVRFTPSGIVAADTVLFRRAALLARISEQSGVTWTVGRRHLGPPSPPPPFRADGRLLVDVDEVVLFVGTDEVVLRVEVDPYRLFIDGDE